MEVILKEILPSLNLQLDFEDWV